MYNVDSLLSCSSVVMLPFPSLVALTLSIVPAAHKDRERENEGEGAIVRIMI